MSAKIQSNPCIRCGKQRINSEAHEQEVNTFYGKTTVTVTESLCPDSECQHIVSQELEAKRKKKEALDQERTDRMDKMRASKVKIKTI